MKRFRFSLPPLPKPPPAHALDRATLLQLSLLVLMAVGFHFTIGHWLVASYGALIWAVKTAAIFRSNYTPPKLLTLLLTIFSFVLILALYGGWNGQRAGISFLVLLVSLKFLESQALRDYFLVCLMLFFLASSSFLFESSLLNIMLVLAYTASVLAVMLQIANPTRIAWWANFKSACLILIKALPIAILLFLFFPRIQTNFGFIPSQDDLNGDTRLRDSMVSGEFASSAFNTKTAFEVTFEGPTPPNSSLYWRAKVMTQETNFQWIVVKPNNEQLLRAKSSKPVATEGTAQRSASNTSTLNYQIIHQNSSDDYIPYLDYAISPELGTQLDDYSVYRDDKENGIFTYKGTAKQYPHLLDQSITQRSDLLNTRSVPSQRVIQLLKGWKNNASSDAELVQQVFEYYRSQPFVYSLLPPALGDSPMDEFLFETQSGYCEHYASSFTILMRWLGIPARVVVGYQGGNPNNIGNYLEVKYSDAHAWSEVWYNKRWNRVDPTAAISPERIEYGMDALLSQWDGIGFSYDNGALALTDYLNPSGWQQTLQQFKDGWDNVGFQWDKWVVNYDFDAQKTLLANLGLKHGRSLYTLIALLMVGTLSLLAFYFWQLIPKAIKFPEPQKSYLAFVRKFSKTDMEKKLSETPLEYAARLTLRFPHQADEINEISAYYTNLRFGRATLSLAKFKMLVQKFRLRDNEQESK